MIAWNQGLLSKKELHERRRANIVRHAALEFSKRGYSATSMEDIADAMGVKKGALYRYIKSKDELLFEFCNEINKFASTALDNAAQLDGKVEAKLKRFMVDFARSYLGSNLADVTVEINGLTAEQRAIVVRDRQAIEQRLAKLFTAGFADYSLEKGDPELMVHVVLASISALPSRFSESQRLNRPEIAEKLAVTLLTGFRERDLI